VEPCTGHQGRHQGRHPSVSYCQSVMSSSGVLQLFLIISVIHLYIVSSDPVTKEVPSRRECTCYCCYCNPCPEEITGGHHVPSYKSSPPQLSVSDLGSQLSTLASGQVELQKKVEELQQERNSTKYRIEQLEKRISLLEFQSNVSTTETSPPVPGRCMEPDFLCDDSVTCLPEHKICDGNSDCPVHELSLGGEEEIDC